MKSSLLILGVSVLLTGCNSKSVPATAARELTTPTIVDAGCGRCMFARKEDRKCNLAIRVDGKSYFVDGFNIKQFGNPDIQGGMCKKVHRAQVTGKVVNDRFAATTFELIPLASR